MNTEQEKKSTGGAWALGLIIALFAIINIVLLTTGSVPMSWEGIGTIVAAGVTISIFSFLYDDNPLFKAVEHLYVGVSAGYIMVVTWYNVLYPDLGKPIVVNNMLHWRTEFDAYNFVRLVPLLLGVAMLMRVSRQMGWVSRISFAYVIGFYAGVTIPAVIEAYLLRHIGYTVTSLYDPSGPFWSINTLNNFVVLTGVLTVLIYFFFSIEHKGPLGRTVGGIGQVGVYFLMVSFGASFGYTIMARMTLLVDRVDFLLRDWLHLLVSR